MGPHSNAVVLYCNNLHVFLVHDDCVPCVCPAAVVMRAQGQRVNEIPKGSAFHCDGVVLIYHDLKGADLGNVAGEANLGLMQFCLCIVQRAQEKWGYVFEGGRCGQRCVRGLLSPYIME
ncbi:hypothetical protein K503DRAFT_777152 [Rhizopogon vinicolor AM-OR11-026]|uniref:Uncharacterized protein n=1 Tax=Rhizopogon vinicolor AM-OR11-026 TaxID=1314800 RepID=A0A1B7MH68_9AGAM|nr:hypothetical protein K503DRAFT_777152 [Rhizopogon vinicolor AM-OR11-026]